MPLDTAHNVRQLTSKQELWINKSLCIPSAHAMIFMEQLLTKALCFVIQPTTVLHSYCTYVRCADEALLATKMNKICVDYVCKFRVQLEGSETDLHQ